MPLVIALAPGDMVDIGEQTFALDRRQGMYGGTLRRESDGKLFDVNDQRTTEIMTGVRVGVGWQMSRKKTIRLVIDAPKDLVIRWHTAKSRRMATAGRAS